MLQQYCLQYVLTSYTKTIIILHTFNTDRILDLTLEFYNTNRTREKK